MPSTTNEPRPFVRAYFDLAGSTQLLRSQTVRSIPDLIEFNAKQNPKHTFCVQARGLSSELSLQEITFSQLQHAIRRCCAWILESIDGTAAATVHNGVVQKSSPVALLMESDVGLFVHVAAALSLNIPVGMHDC